MSDTVLITGATGLIGSEVTRQLRHKGVAIHYLSRNGDGLRDEPGLRGYHWDPQREEMDPEALKGVRGIINLAGAPISMPWTASNKKTIVQSRTSSLKTLGAAISAMEGPRPDFMVSASAIGIYPSHESHYYTESEDTGDSGFLSTTVSLWEQEALKLSEQGLSVALLRVGLVLAADGGALPQIVRPIRWFAGAPLGNGAQWQSWIHLRDVARLFTFCLSERLEGTYNAVAPNPVTNAKLTCEAAAVLGKPLLLPKVPAWGLKLALGERAQLLLGSQRVSCEKIREEGFTFDFPNLRPALEDLLK